MKELPGAPLLPEGWFYRVTSRYFVNDKRSYVLWVHRPLFWGMTWPVKRVKVENHVGFTFHRPEDPRLMNDIVHAAKKAMGVSERIEGDYR